MSHLKTIEWISDKPDHLLPGKVRMIDQARLPDELVYLETDKVEIIWDAIRKLRVRGAPAIGVAGAMGVVVGIQQLKATDGEELVRAVNKQADYPILILLL